ncbi:DNA-directed RNA polymerase I subunit RPA34.5-domain-containing protein [Phyllosticta capitalensis]
MSKKTKETPVPIPGATPKSTTKESKKDKKKSKPVAKKVEVSASSSESESKSSSGEEESSGDESVEEKKANGKTAPEESSSEGSGSESSSEESESESEEETKEEPTRRDVQTVTLRPAKPFEPPSGFKKAKSNISSSSNLSKLFQSTDLSKKQIWHITAPASIPLKQVKELALGQGMEQKTVLEHNGAEYAFIRESDDSSTASKLLVPTEKGYAPIPTALSETLHLQQVVRLPHVQEKQEEASHAMKFVIRPEKAARPQPDNLRMRYRPVGNADAPEIPKVKRKHEKPEAEGEKKSKKSKRESAGAEAMEGVEMTGAKAEDGEKKKKKKDKKEKKKA